MILLLPLLLVLSGPLAAAEPWQQPRYILDSFVTIALRAEHGPDPLQLRKWQEPVRVHVEHQVGDRALHEQLIDAHLQQLAGITGHPIRRVASAAAANVELLLVRQADLASIWRRRAQEAVPHGALCLARIESDGRGRIRRALVAIPVDQARLHGRLVSCIVEELTQILGLPNDSDRVFPSIFNDRSTDQLLSGLDLVLLKLLYDPRLHAGMSLDQVRASAPEVIADLVASGLVREATRQAHQGALPRMLGY